MAPIMKLRSGLITGNPLAPQDVPQPTNTDEREMNPFQLLDRLPLLYKWLRGIRDIVRSPFRGFLKVRPPIIPPIPCSILGGFCRYSEEGVPIALKGDSWSSKIGSLGSRFTCFVG
jgi:hypothetical protein